MPTNPGQGNTTQGSFVNFPPGGTTTNVYVYTAVATPVVGTTLFWTGNGSITAPAGTYRLTINGVKKKATVNTLGIITSFTDCTWNNAPFTYNPPYTSTKNNCVGGSCSVAGSTVTLNDGNPANAYSTTASYTSYISQADADAQALAIATAEFDANKQSKVNEFGYCTWTYSSGYAAAGAYCQTYTRNNCGGNCDAGTWQTCSTVKSGYSASSTTSCDIAYNAANTAAYNAAVSEVQSAGQTNANNNATCCCWVAASTAEKCNGCEYKGNLEKNQCTGAFRNTEVTANPSCNCGATCGGTYWYYYCDGTTRMRESQYNCTGVYAGTRETYQTCDTVNCGAITSPEYTYQNYNTCYACANVPVYKDTRGTCSSTNGQYYVYYNGSYVYRGGQPSGTLCDYNPSCVDVGAGYCSNGDYVINRTNQAACNSDPCSVRIIEENSVTYGCYNPCDGFRDPNYQAQGYTTCYSCQNKDVYKDVNTCSYTVDHYFIDNYGWVDIGTGLPGSSCNYNSNCVDTGNAYCYGNDWVIDTYQANGCLSGGCGRRTIDPNSTTYGCYTPPPTCYTYPIISNNSSVWVDGSYTTCGGNTDYFTFYSYDSYSQVGSVCARSGTVSVTNGNGQVGSSSGTC